MKIKVSNNLAVIIVLFFTILCQAQKKQGFIPPSIDDEEIPVVKTELPVPKNGKNYVVQYFKGITDGVESRIAVKNLGYIIRPAMVQVISEDGRELVIELVKKNWEDVVRSGSTKKGAYQSSFKTALEFGIKISAKENGIPFVVVVSAGIELFPASNLFVDASTMRSGDGNEEVKSSKEARLIGQESGQSNILLYIIIAIVLTGIFILLAVLMFKKNAKGTTTILLLLMFSWPTNANVVVAIAQSAVGGMAGNLAKGLADHYGKGGFNGDNPLSENDRDFEPEPDPRGQPSLPSSCYNIARMSNSGFSGGSGGNIGKGGATETNSTTNTGGGTNMTLGTGGVAGGVSGSEIGADVDYEEGKDRDFVGERKKLNDNNQKNIRNAQNRLEEGRREAQEKFNRASREASKKLDRDLLAANEDVDLRVQATVTHANTNTQLITELSSRNSRLEIDFAKEIAQLAEGLAKDLIALAADEAAANQEQQNNNGREKDPDRKEEKGAESGEIGKGVGSPTDEEGGSSNSEPSENNENREKMAGCKCLEEAYSDLQQRRYSLEKLLKIGQHTKKVTDFGISFGDDFSGVHGVSGLAWQKVRADVLKSIDKFDITYDNKYKELTGKLYNALIKIDECENKLGYENWYSQSGFIYYEFMKARYATYK